MHLAPASSRGAFLKARLAVNGIQCAARSFGTLTVPWLGLLSSIGGLFVFRVGSWPQTISFETSRERLWRLKIAPDPALLGARPASDIRSRDPEHLAVGIL